MYMKQRIIDRTHVGEVLQQIYESDLNLKINLISEGGYFYVGQEEKRTPLQGTTIEEAITHLAFRLAKEFPASDFAGWWIKNFSEKTSETKLV